MNPPARAQSSAAALLRAAETEASLQACQQARDKGAAELLACSEAAAASASQASNQLEAAAAQARTAMSEAQQMRDAAAAAEAGRQEAESAAARGREELGECSHRCNGCSVQASGAGQQSEEAVGPGAPTMKELSPDSLKLSADDAAGDGQEEEEEEEGEGEEHAEGERDSCGLTPDTCEGSGGGDEEDGGRAVEESHSEAHVGVSASGTASAAVPPAKVAPVVLMSEGELQEQLAREATHGGLTFVKFFAPWCGHCKRLAPVWEDVGARFAALPHVTLAKVDCTQAQDLCKRLGIEGLPTLKLFEDGAPADYSGKKDAASLVAFLQSKLPGVELAPPVAPAAADARAGSAGDEVDDAPSCGLTPGSCAGEAGQPAAPGLSMAGGGGAGSAGNGSGSDLSEAEIAAMYANVAQRRESKLTEANAPASSGSRTADVGGAAGPDKVVEGGATEASAGVKAGAAKVASQEKGDVVGAGGGDVPSAEVARKAAEAQRRWEEALKNDPKRAEQMEYRARRAAGPALAGSDEEKGGTAAENKFCQSVAGEHAIFDGKEGGCRCKTGYVEDDEGKCVAQEESRRPAKEDQATLGSAADRPSPASPTASSAGGEAPGSKEAQSKAAEAQRRWEEALKNDPKRAEQMEYRARRAAGPALAGSDEEKGGTAAENKFCQSVAGEHAIFDGKEGGCRCKTGYVEDDEGKCMAQEESGGGDQVRAADAVGMIGSDGGGSQMAEEDGLGDLGDAVGDDGGLGGLDEGAPGLLHGNVRGGGVGSDDLGVSFGSSSSSAGDDSLGSLQDELEAFDAGSASLGDGLGGLGALGDEVEGEGGEDDDGLGGL